MSIVKKDPSDLMAALKKDRNALLELQKKLKRADEKKRKDETGYSLENLRLVTLLNQMQALQAVQGLQELKPKGKGKRQRFEIPDDPKERAFKRRWLMFKADWLQALLEDALDELEAIDRAEGITDGTPGSEARRSPRQSMGVGASYGHTLKEAHTENRSCTVVDMSLGGMRLLLNEEINVNTPVTISLEEGMHLDGTVVWSRKAEEGVKGYNTGLVFTHIDEILLNKIERYLAEHAGKSAKVGR